VCIPPFSNIFISFVIFRQYIKYIHLFRYLHTVHPSLSICSDSKKSYIHIYTYISLFRQIYRSLLKNIWVSFDKYIGLFRQICRSFSICSDSTRYLSLLVCVSCILVCSDHLWRSPVHPLCACPKAHVPRQQQQQEHHPRPYTHPL